MEQTDYDSRTALHIAAAEGDASLLVHSFLNNLGFDIQTRTNEVWNLHYNVSVWFGSMITWIRLTCLFLSLCGIAPCFFLSGHLEAAIFLTEICKVNPHMKDR